MAMSEDEKPGLPVQAALVAANLGLWWLLDTVMYAMGISALLALLQGLQAGGVVWAALGLAAAAGSAAALFGPILRPWSPSRIWLNILTALAWNLGVILALLLR